MKPKWVVTVEIVVYADGSEEATDIVDRWLPNEPTWKERQRGDGCIAAVLAMRAEVVGEDDRHWCGTCDALKGAQNDD